MTASDGSAASNAPADAGRRAASHAQPTELLLDLPAPVKANETASPFAPPRDRLEAPPGSPFASTSPFARASAFTRTDPFAHDPFARSVARQPSPFDRAASAFGSQQASGWRRHRLVHRNHLSNHPRRHRRRIVVRRVHLADHAATRAARSSRIGPTGEHSVWLPCEEVDYALGIGTGEHLYLPGDLLDFDELAAAATAERLYDTGECNCPDPWQAHHPDCPAAQPDPLVAVVLAADQSPLQFVDLSLPYADPGPGAWTRTRTLLLEARETVLEQPTLLFDDTAAAARRAEVVLAVAGNDPDQFGDDPAATVRTGITAGGPIRDAALDLAATVLTRDTSDVPALHQVDEHLAELERADIWLRHPAELQFMTFPAAHADRGAAPHDSALHDLHGLHGVTQAAYRSLLTDPTATPWCIGCRELIMTPLEH